MKPYDQAALKCLSMMAAMSFLGVGCISDCGLAVNYRGQVIDAATEEPIQNARYFITIPAREIDQSEAEETGTTDENGYIEGQGMAMWYCGLFSMNNPKYLGIQIEADSYRTELIRFPRKDLEELPTNEYFMDLGVVALEVQ